jgi:hypothetical protein
MDARHGVRPATARPGRSFPVDQGRDPLAASVSKADSTLRSGQERRCDGRPRLLCRTWLRSTQTESRTVSELSADAPDSIGSCRNRPRTIALRRFTDQSGPSTDAVRLDAKDVEPRLYRVSEGCVGVRDGARYADMSQPSPVSEHRLASIARASMDKMLIALGKDAGMPSGNRTAVKIFDSGRKLSGDVAGRGRTDSALIEDFVLLSRALRVQRDPR